MRATHRKAATKPFHRPTLLGETGSIVLEALLSSSHFPGRVAESMLRSTQRASTLKSSGITIHLQTNIRVAFAFCWIFLSVLLLSFSTTYKASVILSFSSHARARLWDCVYWVWGHLEEPSRRCMLSTSLFSKFSSVAIEKQNDQHSCYMKESHYPCHFPVFVNPCHFGARPCCSHSCSLTVDWGKARLCSDLTFLSAAAAVAPAPLQLLSRRCSFNRIHCCFCRSCSSCHRIE